MNIKKILFKYLIYTESPKEYIALGLGWLWVALFYFLMSGLQISFLSFFGFGILFILRGIGNLIRVHKQEKRRKKMKQRRVTTVSMENNQ